PAPQVEGVEPLPGKSHYFIGNDPQKWRTDLPTYARVQYKGVYPGIDLVFYGNQRQLEYDLLVAPGADPKAIRLAFTGADRLSLDAEGNLVLHIARGEILQRAPLIYQEMNGTRERISGRYVLQGKDRVGFEVSAYDPTRPLVIDPVLAYSTYLGGSEDLDFGNGIAVDGPGNAYVTGNAQSDDFPTTLGAWQPAYGGGNSDAFVTKLAPNGALVYSTYLGGSSKDFGTGIAADASGNAVYVTGATFSLDFRTTLGAFDMACGSDGNCDAPFPGGPGVADIFVTKLNAAGSAPIYSTYLGGSSADFGHGIAVDGSGNAYVTGMTLSANFPTFPTPGALDATCGTDGNCNPGPSGPQSDAFVTQLNPAGSGLVYSTYLGGSGNEGGGGDISGGIAVDGSGNAYVTGSTDSPDFPTVNPLQAAFAGGFTDAFVAKLNAAGSALAYSTYLGGNDGDYGEDIAVDSSGNAHVTGSTSSSNFPTRNSLQATLAGGFLDAFVTKLNAAGSGLIYSTYLGGSGPVEGTTGRDAGHGIAVDGSGRAYVAGDTSSTDFPIANALQPASGGSLDAFIARIEDVGQEVEVAHDLAVTKITAPRTVTLTRKRPVQTGQVTVEIQNRSPHDETVQTTEMLASLVGLEVRSLPPEICPDPTPVLRQVMPPKKFPLTLKPKQKLNVVFNVTFDCANDPEKSTPSDPDHDDYSYAATVDHAALDGEEDSHPDDDKCPRSVQPPFEIDLYPDGSIRDKGCGGLKPDKTFGAEILTDVVVK
ncbi:MAG: SBBP repeat-containing protein, partial [Candidatus Tectomicrobia bacterium]|nr:SBBP repeat-containing protein [Candidatus Tectomicrobia bacterium]